MLTVACVLKSGGEYDATYVGRLAAGVARHLPAPHRFVCLSDVPVPVERIPLPATCPQGWWAKQLLFMPGAFSGRVLFFDLDTVIVGDLSSIAAYDGPFGMISDFYRPELAQSGVLAWDANGPIASELWEAFDRDAGVVQRYPSHAAFIRSVVRGREDRLDTAFTGQIVSYKVHCQHRIPAVARVVCFHGQPRPAALAESHPLSGEWRAA